MRACGRLTDVKGLMVGHWTDVDGGTGCTVVLCEIPFIASVDVRGGAPGTRETDLLAPGRLVERVDAILLAGGSAFGLGAAEGVVRWLHERGRGHPTGVIPVPIVPAAIIFDLGVGRPVWPDASAGYSAVDSATVEFERGCVGVGTGATVGKSSGPYLATKGGVGTASMEIPGGLIVGALVVVNALGNVTDPETGRVIAGARSPDGGFVGAGDWAGVGWEAAAMGNTTLGVVATNANLDRCGAYRMAQVAHDGLARTIRPSHTQFDGDTVFSVATGERDADLSLICAAAADALAASVLDAVRSATALHGFPASGELLSEGTQ